MSTSIYVTCQEVFHVLCDSPADSELPGQTRSYLLRSGRHHRPLRCPYLRLRPRSFFRDPCPQPLTDQPEDPAVRHPVLEKLEHPCDRGCRKIRACHNPAPRSPSSESAHPQRVQGIVAAARGPKTLREPLKVLFIDTLEDSDQGRLDDLVSSLAIPKGRCRPSSLRI